MSTADALTYKRNSAYPELSMHESDDERFLIDLQSSGLLRISEVTASAPVSPTIDTEEPDEPDCDALTALCNLAQAKDQSYCVPEISFVNVTRAPIAFKKFKT